MIGTPITIKNFENGGEIHINDHSDKFRVVALQSYPTFANDVRANNVPRSGAHGEAHMPTFYSGMSIVLEGVIVGDNEAEVWQLKQQLDEVARLPRRGLAPTVPSEDIETLATNLCTNPRGRIATTGWTPLDATVSTEDGKNGIRVETTQATASGVTFDLVATPDETLHAAIDIKNEADTPREFSFSILALDSGNNVLTSDTVIEEIETSQRLYATLDIPSGTAKVVLEVERTIEDAVIGDVFVIDRTLALTNPPVNFDPETDFFDGDTSDLSRVRYDWTGQRGLSESVMVLRSFASMYRNSLRISFTNPLGKSVFVDATPTTVVRYDREMQRGFMLNFQLLLRSNFPVMIVDNKTPEQFHGELGEQRKGFKLPFKVPFSLGETFIENPLTITTDSAGFAVVRMYGSDGGTIVNPQITNLTNGSSVKILRSLIGSERFFLIDGVYQQMTDQDGRTVQPYSDGDYIFLDKGENILLYSADYAIPN